MSLWGIQRPIWLINARQEKRVFVLYLPFNQDSIGNFDVAGVTKDKNWIQYN